jgi:hypothetical protein
MITKLKQLIDLQIQSNQEKNLFHRNIFRIMQCSQSTIDAFQNITLVENDVCSLINYAAEKSLQELCRVNQYFSFSESDIIALKILYWNLYQNIQKNKFAADTIFQNHFNNLKSWLNKTNPFSSELYYNDEAILKAVVCSEYSSALQKEILSLNKIPLLEPILDIGCGKNGTLVKSFISDNLDAHGIDRFASAFPHCEKADWLNYNYGLKKWGTIISNAGFSNHFIHHDLRNDGNSTQYAKTYMNILQALKIGGCFYYAPDLPFIEMHLDEKTFLITKQEITNTVFQTTTIKRLK